MKTLTRLASLVLLLALAACAKDSRRNSVWLVVKNETGRDLRDVALDYSGGAFHYQIFGTGMTYGGWARVKQRQAL